MTTTEDKATALVQLRTQVEAIAKALGPSWYVLDPDPDTDAGDLCIGNRTRPASYVLNIRKSWRDESRWVIRGSLPGWRSDPELSARHIQLSAYGIDNPEATVSASRSPQAIAGEILRRVIPGYTTAYEEMERRRAHAIACFDRTKALTLELAALLGADAKCPGDPHAYNTSEFTIYVNRAGLYLNIRVSQSSEPTITLDRGTMDPDTARRVFAALGTLAPA